MKKIILVIATFSFIVQAHAQSSGERVKVLPSEQVLGAGYEPHTNPSDLLAAKLNGEDSDPENTYFKILKEMFNAGVAPNIEKIVGILWVGRCFFINMPDKPRARANLIWRASNDAGPISEKIKKYRLRSMINENKP